MNTEKIYRCENCGRLEKINGEDPPKCYCKMDGTENEYVIVMKEHVLSCK